MTAIELEPNKCTKLTGEYGLDLNTVAPRMSASQAQADIAWQQQQSHPQGPSGYESCAIQEV